MKKVDRDIYVECVAVVHSAGDEGLCDGSSGFLKELLEYLAQHVKV